MTVHVDGWEVMGPVGERLSLVDRMSDVGLNEGSGSYLSARSSRRTLARMKSDKCSTNLGRPRDKRHSRSDPRYLIVGRRRPVHWSLIARAVCQA